MKHDERTWVDLDAGTRVIICGVRRLLYEGSDSEPVEGKRANERGFEPIGTSFVVEGGDWLTLELPVSAVADVEIVVWPNGVTVWVPLPGDYLVRDSSGSELDRP